jgi:hypothetical protein
MKPRQQLGHDEKAALATIIGDRWRSALVLPPYLIQGIRHPSAAGIQTIRSRIREISIAAEARRL